MKQLKVGQFWRGKKIKEVRKLSNGWVLLKTENSKSTDDFKVRVIFSLKPQRSLTPKHAHFLIDFYGKLCADRQKARFVFDSIYEVWQGNKIEDALKNYQLKTLSLPGYPLEYILNALEWILEQEDINFKSRPLKKQREIDTVFKRLGICPPPNRKGSQLAIFLFAEVLLGTHPVEALLKAGLDIRPKR